MHSGFIVFYFHKFDIWKFYENSVSWIYYWIKCIEFRDISSKVVSALTSKCIAILIIEFCCDYITKNIINTKGVYFNTDKIYLITVIAHWICIYLVNIKTTIK